MQIIPVKTALVRPGDKVETLLDTALTALAENTIVCITSKVISLCEGSVIPKADVADKYELIKQEADAYLPKPDHNPYDVHLTIKNKILIATAGIDESNGEDIYILYPRDIQASAWRIWSYLRMRHGVQHLGVLITDSHTTPLRWGVTGIGLGWCGFEPLYDYRGKPDCFGKPLRMTQINMLDALAVPAVYIMGEGAEQTPIALITDAPKVTFQDRAPNANEIAATQIAIEDDLYAPILTKAGWVRK